MIGLLAVQARARPLGSRPTTDIEAGISVQRSVPAGLDAVGVEGTGIVRDAIVPWIDASMWGQGDLDEQERRLVARDGDSADQCKHVAAWLSEELLHMRRERPWRRATVVVDGTSGLPHDPATEVVVAHLPERA